jgi:hypothetical protein
MAYRGWVALDIDGTITDRQGFLKEETNVFLSRLYERLGWRIVFATGRSCTFAQRILSALSFPYVLVAQNGSLVMEIPSRQIWFKRYLPSAVLPWIEKAYRGIPSDFVVYGGVEVGDVCFYRPSRLTSEQLAYVARAQEREAALWRSVERFSLERFPLVKCFGSPVTMRKVFMRLKETSLFHLSFIRDPFLSGQYLTLATDVSVSKGSALEEVFRQEGRYGQVIAVGDDENDMSLLRAADIKIAMSHAPEGLRKIADFIAPSSEDGGLIQALKIALGIEG